MKFRLPSPLWILFAAVAIVVIEVALRFGYPIYRQQVAIQVIQRLGGVVRVRRNGPEWFRDRLPDGWNEAFGRVMLVDMGISTVTDADLRLFKDLPGAEMVSVADSQVTDAGLRALSSLEHLEMLYVDRTRVTDVGLGYLASLPRLKYVWAIRSGVTRKGVDRVNSVAPRLRVMRYRFREPEMLDVE